MTTQSTSPFGPATEELTAPPTTEIPVTADGPVTPTPSRTAPAVHAPRWSGKKTAVAAALAIGLSSADTLTAAALMPEGTGAQSGQQGGPGGRFGPGGGMPGQFGQQQGPQGQLGQQQGQLGQPGGMPGQAPGQLGQQQGQLGQSQQGGTTGQVPGGVPGQSQMGDGSAANGTTT